jgi:hypothetical protein
LGDRTPPPGAAKARFQFAIESAALGFLNRPAAHRGEIQNIAGIEAEIDGLGFAGLRIKSPATMSNTASLRPERRRRAARKLTATAIGRASTFVKDGTDIAAGHTKRRKNSTMMPVAARRRAQKMGRERQA